MTTVVHFNQVKERWNWRLQRWDHPDEIIYCGRRNKEYHLPLSPWANPIRMHSDSAEARAQAIEQYRAWITTTEEGLALLPKLPQLRGRILVCWCKPKACHCDVLLELLGEKDHVEQPAQTGLDGVTAAKPPLLLWDEGMAGLKVGMNKSGRLYRDSEAIQLPLGLPGKAYMTWEEWYRDYLKETLRVHGRALTMNHEEYARYRYVTRLNNLEGRSDQRSNWECAILHELMDELEGAADGK
jgi:hypothetical protein